MKITTNRWSGKQHQQQQQQQQHCKNLQHNNNNNNNNNNKNNANACNATYKWYHHIRQQFCHSKHSSAAAIKIDFCRNVGALLCALIGLLFIFHNLVSGACAAPQSCILCDKDDLKTKHSSSNNYEEFLFEHQVTRQDAINALKGYNDSFYNGPSSDSSCKSVTCTKKIMNYCLGPQFINDHCWCEFGHTDEGLPFVPHICYVGEKLHTASVGSCFFYEEVKECCCAAALAKQWRHISAAPSYATCNSLGLLISAQLLLLHIVAHHLINII